MIVSKNTTICFLSYALKSINHFSNYRTNALDSFIVFCEIIDIPDYQHLYLCRWHNEHKHFLFCFMYIYSINIWTPRKYGIWCFSLFFLLFLHQLKHLWTWIEKVAFNGIISIDVQIVSDIHSAFAYGVCTFLHDRR